MPVDAIGTTQTTQDSALPQSSTIDQEDFIRLFLAQLQFQDPLEPVDNREFLAQLAQFSALEQSRQLSQNTNDMLTMDASTQAVSLLNRQVDTTDVSGITRSGTVVAVSFGTAGPELSVRESSGTVTTGVRLSQITLVKP